MLQHWGVHCFTCLIKTGLATKQREQMPRSMKIPITVDGSIRESVVCGTSQMFDERAAVLSSFFGQKHSRRSPLL